VTVEEIYQSVFHEKDYQYEGNAGFNNYYVSGNITESKVNIGNDHLRPTRALNGMI